jgi:glycosyltransferase involved in cell wall biosynthesis
MITAITKVRNEALILEDTLRHWLQHCESILLYDDDSTDNSVEIAESFDQVRVIHGTAWSPKRTAEETRIRALLLEQVRTPWTFCFDADERLVGELPDLSTADAFRFRLFDGYITPGFQKPYTEGPLVDLKRMWGPEFRDILMLFKTDRASYVGLDRREPVFSGTIALAEARIKHFGKCLSVEHWDETCDYYSQNWPAHYTEKWQARKGKAIHIRSDFGKPLQRWSDLMNTQDSWVRL